MPRQAGPADAAQPRAHSYRQPDSCIQSRCRGPDASTLPSALVVCAHPLGRHSTANRALVDAIRDLPTVTVRDLYELYPDFNVDPAAEEPLLAAADLIILQHPIYWYSVPPLLKQWLDSVFHVGWAYGPGGTALRGKDLWWLVTTGGDDASFAFVVFAAASAAHVFMGEVGAVLVLVVALSMVATPMLLLLHDMVLAPRYAAATARPDDVIDDDASPVIMAGFGRFGQIVGRLLFANRIRATVLDHDPDQIELLRKFGFKVFCGNATRLDLLEAAGARTARVLVVTIDDVDDSLELEDLESLFEQDRAALERELGAEW